MSDNHDPAAAEVDQPEHLTVTYDDREWTFPSSPDALRYSEIRAMESGKLGEVLEAILPADQHRRLTKENPRAPWLKGLLDAWLEAAGLDSGG
jgi:hypothetical protein